MGSVSNFKRSLARSQLLLHDANMYVCASWHCIQKRSVFIFYLASKFEEVLPATASIDKAIVCVCA